MKKTTLCCACACIVFLTGCASTRQPVRRLETDAFTRADAAIIRKYYRLRHDSAAHRGQHVSFVSGDILPAEAARTTLPAELEHQLSPLAQNLVRVKTGNSLLILDKQSSRIADTLDL